MSVPSESEMSQTLTYLHNLARSHVKIANACMRVSSAVSSGTNGRNSRNAKLIRKLKKLQMACESIDLDDVLYTSFPALHSDVDYVDPSGIIVIDDTPQLVADEEPSTPPLVLTQAYLLTDEDNAWMSPKNAIDPSDVQIN